MFVERREVRRVSVAAAVICAAAWLVLLARPALLHPHAHGVSAAMALLAPDVWRAPLVGWFVMLAAMMVPALISPVLYIRSRSFAHRRARSVVLFIAAYIAVWLVAGLVLIPVAMAAISIGLRSYGVALAAVVVAVVWQCSPLKQVFLNRCHAYRELAAAGYAADRSAIRFGFEHGIYCVGSCWALMLVPMLFAAHLAAMAIATVLIFADRVERPRAPSWRWRGPGALGRTVLAEMKAQLHNPRTAPTSIRAT